MDTERHTEQIHPGLIGQIGHCVMESKVISHVTRANKHWSHGKSEPLIRIFQFCVTETHKKASIVTSITFSVVLHTSSQLKHSRKRSSHAQQSFQHYCKGLWNKLFCSFYRNNRVVMDYLWSMCCAEKRASRPELAFWKNSRDEKIRQTTNQIPSESWHSQSSPSFPLTTQHWIIYRQQVTAKDDPFPAHKTLFWHVSAKY